MAERQRDRGGWNVYKNHRARGTEGQAECQRAKETERQKERRTVCQGCPLIDRTARERWVEKTA